MVTMKELLTGLALGEGPHWDETTGTLYFVDIEKNAVHKYRPQDKHHSSVVLNNTVGAVIPVEGQDDTFLVGLKNQIARLKWNGTTHDVKILKTVDEDKIHNRFNDGKADANGNLWFGTMGQDRKTSAILLNQGTLYRFNSKCEAKGFQENVTISNGMAWDKTNSVMFYIDSSTKKVYVYDFIKNTSDITSKRVHYDLDTDNIEGLPDGMTIDANDDLWVACWGAGMVLKISGAPGKGKLVQKLEMPQKRVTSVCFGGSDMKTLFVTTMADDNTNNGSVFAVDGLNVVGTHSRKVKCVCE